MTNFFTSIRTTKNEVPVTDQQLKALAAQGIINSNTPLATDGRHKGTAGQDSRLVCRTAAAECFSSHSKQRSEVVNLSVIISRVTILFLLLVSGGCGGLPSPSTFIAAKQEEQRVQCANHIKQIVLAFHNYYDAHDALPPLYTVDKNGKPLPSWRVLILPYLEQSALFDAIRKNEPWNSEYNKQFHDKIIDIYRCPTNGSVHNGNDYCTYSAIAGEVFVPAKKPADDPGFGEKGNSFATIADGTSNTIAIVEMKEPFCWMDPTADITLDELAKGINKGRVGSFHPGGGINIGMCDGRVRFMSQTVDTSVLRALGTCAGGESVRD